MERGHAQIALLNHFFLSVTYVRQKKDLLAKTI